MLLEVPLVKLVEVVEELIINPEDMVVVDPLHLPLGLVEVKLIVVLLHLMEHLVLPTQVFHNGLELLILEEVEAEQDPPVPAGVMVVQDML